MKRIHALPDLLISQIAAGEIIERPAAVVKELIENSLDAGAQMINVDIEKGGMDLIRVSDDGNGIAAADLPLALERHATSKISELADLERVSSMGFRGEALASICSVARVKLTSRERGASLAYVIDSAKNEVEPASLAQGTIVEARDLYVHTPARRKFLRSPQTEYAHCEEATRRVALAHIEVGFTLTHERSLRRQWPQCTPQERIEQIFGEEWLCQARSIETGSAGMRLTGFALDAAYSRAGRDQQYFFVNGRNVRDKVLSHAARCAYADFLHSSRQPAYVLFLELDPATVDVNVHPAKTEVRFRDARSIHQFIASSLEKSLGNHLQYQGSPTTSILAHNPSIGLENTRSPNQAYAPPNTQRAPVSYLRTEYTLMRGEGKGSTSNSSAATQSYLEFLSSARTTPDMPNDGNEAIPALGYARAQLAGVYVLAENQAGLVLVDIHAAHERLLYEKLKKSSSIIAQQRLLVPARLIMDEKLMATAQEHHATIAGFGFEISPAAPGELWVRAIPALLSSENIPELVRKILEELSVFPFSQLSQEQSNSVLATVACHAAVRSGQQLTLPEMDALLREMERIDRTDYCNHGRPTWVQLTMVELDRMFMRGR